MFIRNFLFAVFAAALLSVNVLAADEPAIGEWDGVTPSATLDGPYEDTSNYNVPFGIISYYNHPWRGYMDTWDASKFLELPAAQWNVNDKYAEPLCELLEETGIRSLRIEIGWGNLNWNDELPEGRAERTANLLKILQKHNIRPMILLNAHHGIPCPVRRVDVEVVEDAQKGDKTIKVKDASQVRPHFTGIQHPRYIAAYPMVTKVDDDGTLHLSSGLPTDIKAGRLSMPDLKYQPFQGSVLKDGTPVPEAQRTADGWIKYAKAVATMAQEALGTEGQADSGFDIEVWNEQTFGSNFLDRNRYYDDKFEYAEPFVYRKTREMKPYYRPDARLEFEQKGAYAILPMTIDFFNNPANGFSGVRVVSGFANQWPWDSGTGLWDGQAGFSRHYYTGGWRDCSPETPLGKKNSATVNALGELDGKRQGREWHSIVPGSGFVPTFRMGFPEFFHSGFKTESLSRDLIPDSRLVRFNGHGRFTHNGDYNIAEVWQTEVNWHRWPFFDKLMKETGAKRDDPRLLALDKHMADKLMLRQYIFHGHKGLRRIYIFCLNQDPYSFGMLPPDFYKALDENDLQLTPEVRKHIPEGWKGMAWLTDLMKTGKQLEAPRPLKVEKLVEYKPRLLFAGDGTAAHPSLYNRDQFAFMPYQLSESKYVIPYYVVTFDVTHDWDTAKNPLDPARYDMPDQEFDVTIGNIRGTGAAVTVYDPLKNESVPVEIVDSSQDTLTLRLQTTDYPRVLQVEESQPGPQIMQPQVFANEDGVINVTWKTNIPVDASITYGRDWENRSANMVELENTPRSMSHQGEYEYYATIPTGIQGVIAVRIIAEADGLREVWPHWDEDPAGQVVVPGAARETLDRQEAPAVGAVTGENVLDLSETNAAALPVVAADKEAGFSIRLPEGSAVEHAGDVFECTIGAGAEAVQLICRSLSDENRVTDYLPFTAVGDVVSKAQVVLPSGVRASLFTYELAPPSHPGMTNTSQQYLTVPMPEGNVLLLSATGTPAAMQANAQALRAIAASIDLTK